MDAVRFLCTLAREEGGKVADHRVAEACGAKPRTVTAWRYGVRRVPQHLLADLRRLRRERARRLIAEGKRELAELVAETRQ